MGIKSVMNTDRLFWLGRYSERVYTTLKLFSLSFDSLIEQNGDDHRAFCQSLEIPDIYSDKDDFIDRYPFSLEVPDSIFSNLQRAYDNAIELREEIGSETLSFVQMAIYEMKSAKRMPNASGSRGNWGYDPLVQAWEFAPHAVRSVHRAGKRRLADGMEMGR